MTVRCYVDSSALAKLVISERESPNVRGFLATSSLRVTSAISQTELRRAAARGGKQLDVAARRVLTVVSQVDVSREILAGACSVAPTELRTLDAIHLATALQIASDIDCFVTYDARLGRAAASAGFAVAHPGRAALD